MLPDRLLRSLRHLRVDRRDVRRVFPPEAMDRVAQRIAEGESRHAAELRIAIEPSLGLLRAWRGDGVRERALEVFGLLRVWDTEGNNGVLIHVVLAEHSVEVVADRAAARRIPQAQWTAIADGLCAAFHSGAFVEGLLAAIDRLEPLLIQAFPVTAENPDELPNRPEVL